MGNFKEKMTEPLSFDAEQGTFVDVPLNQTLVLQTIDDMVRKRGYYPTYSSHPSS
jgi:hypothetical protein